MKNLNFALVGIAFRELTHDTLTILEDAKIPTPMHTIENMEQALGVSLAEFAYIEKCNAVFFLAAFKEVPPTDILKKLVKAWGKLTGDKVLPHASSIVALKSAEALNYLLETAVGLHSVVIGDSQVYSQVRDPIQHGAKASKNSVFRYLLRLIRNVEKEIQAKTGLHRGYTSLERLACWLINKELNDNEPVAVVGLGSSGRLVTKVLREEQKREVLVANRTLEDLDIMVSRYDSKPARFMPQDYLQSVCGVVLALENNEETRKYAEYFQGQYAQVPHLRIVIDLASPPLLKPIPNGICFADITTLTEMAQNVVKDRSKDINLSKAIIQEMVKAAY